MHQHRYKKKQILLCKIFADLWYLFGIFFRGLFNVELRDISNCVELDDFCKVFIGQQILWDILER